MTGIMEGIKVIDMGHVVGVPAGAATLADWGAEIIKVEPLSGEMARSMGQQSRQISGKETPGPGTGLEINWSFQLLNRNKKGIALNLKTKAGRDILYQLVEKADVFVSNYQLVALTQLKADYASLQQINPRIIYGLMTGYGTTGPEKDERSFDYSAAWARSGAMYLMGEPGDVPPPQRGGMMDRVTGFLLVAGIAAALWHRERTGEGQLVEVSLYHSGVWTIASDIQAALMGRSPEKHQRDRARNPLFNSYRTRDDRWFWLAMGQAELFWTPFCQALGRPELENDPRFNTTSARQENCQELIRLIDETIASRTIAEWEKIFRQHDLIYGRVASPAEVAADPQAMANGFFAELSPHDVAGKVVTTPVKFHQNPASVRFPAPELGQHTEEILLTLGYNWTDIEQLKKQGTIL